MKLVNIARCALVYTAACAAERAPVGDVYTTLDYAQDGLVLHYDGIENAGRGLHAAAPAKWANLAGAADGTYDVALPAWTTAEEKAVFSDVVHGLDGDGGKINGSKPERPRFASVAGISDETPVVTVEIVMARAAWTYTDNYYNVQSVFDMPRGGISYRGNATNNFNVTYPISTTQTDLFYWKPEAVATNAHTLAVTLGVGANTLWLDGARDSVSLKGNYISAWGTGYSFFGNLRAPIRVWAIRLYNRALSANEIVRHRELDRIRFFEGPTDGDLRFHVMPVGVQALDGARAARPCPVVSNHVDGVALSPGRDYTLSWLNTTRAGTGSMEVKGVGAYAGCARRLEYRIVDGFTAAVREGGPNERTAAVAFPPADAARALFVAGGAADGGRLTNGWERVEAAGVVPAGVAALDVPLSAQMAACAHLRFFLETPADPRVYVADGLCALWDGICNAGTPARPVHDAAATRWVDLSGHGNDVDLPAWVTVDETALVSDVQLNDAGEPQKKPPVLNQVNGLPEAPGELTQEIVARRVAWKKDDNYGNMQAVSTTPLGYVCYRQNDDFGFGTCSIAWSEEKERDCILYNTWRHQTARVDAVHTLSARLAPRENSFAVDGVLDPTVLTVNRDPYWDGRLPERNYKFFGNLRAEVAVHGVRLYARHLTEEELAWNAAVDAARFRGGNGRVLAASAPAAVGIPAAGVPRTGGLAVTTAPSARPRRLFAAWGATDGGVATNGWEHVAQVAEIPAGTTHLPFVALPPAAQRATAGRLFLVDVYDSASYVAEGLLVQYDGEHNACVDGVRRHDDAATTWADLTGRGGAVALPAYVQVEARALLSRHHLDGEAVSVAVPGASSASVLSLEVVAQYGGWQIWTDPGNLQAVFDTPLGSLGYRYWDENGFYYMLPTESGTRMLYDWKPDALTRDVHTLAAVFRTGGSELHLDGAEDRGGSCAWWAAEPLDTCRLFSNRRGDVRLFSVRLYGRRLSPEEFARNAAVDAVRFRGAAPAFRASSLLDFRTTGLAVFVR